MRTSNPPSYDKIFQIYVGSTATITEYSAPASSAMLIPAHRGLLVLTSDQVTVDFYNLDGTKSTLTFPINTFLVLPLQIKYYDVTAGSGNLYLYGLA